MMSSTDDGSSRRLPLKLKKGIRKPSNDTEVVAASSVHSKNFYIASLPVVALFNLLRALLYHFILVIKTLYKIGCFIARPWNPTEKLPHAQLEEVTGDSKLAFKGLYHIYLIV